MLCYMLAAALAVTTVSSQANQATIHPARVLEAPCDDVATIDFKNLRISLGRRIFAFQNGVALNHDMPDASGPPDWKAEIERDTVVQPAPGLSVRFLLIHDSHETGSGWCYYLVGYCCSSGRLQEVFRREGLSLSVDRLDSSRVSVGLNTIPGKPVRNHWSYTWDRAKSRYVLSSAWSTP